jgi:hypothetical protein
MKEQMKGQIKESIDMMRKLWKFEKNKPLIVNILHST